MSPHYVRPAAVAVALLVALVGCKRPALPSVGSAAPKMAESGPPVTEQEAEEFGRQVVAAFAAKDADALNRVLAIDDLCERSISERRNASPLQQDRTSQTRLASRRRVALPVVFLDYVQRGALRALRILLRSGLGIHK